jgi:hypothetical protein
VKAKARGGPPPHLMESAATEPDVRRTESEIAFHEREYHTYVILGASEALKPWEASGFHTIQHALSPLLSVARGRAAVRSSQVESISRQPVRFGRISWSPDGHAKWVLGSGQNMGDAPKRIFGDVEVWGPSWTACDREGLAPDIFFAMRSMEGDPLRLGLPSLGSLIILAVAVDTAEDLGPMAERAARQVSQAVATPLTVYQRRPWGRANSLGYSAALNDLIYGQLFTLAKLNADGVGPAMFSEQWMLLTDDYEQGGRASGV